MSLEQRELSCVVDLGLEGKPDEPDFFAGSRHQRDSARLVQTVTEVHESTGLSC